MKFVTNFVAHYEVIHCSRITATRPVQTSVKPYMSQFLMQASVYLNGHARAPETETYLCAHNPATYKKQHTCTWTELQAAHSKEDNCSG